MSLKCPQLKIMGKSLLWVVGRFFGFLSFGLLVGLFVCLFLTVNSVTVWKKCDFK